MIDLSRVVRYAPRPRTITQVQMRRGPVRRLPARRRLRPAARLRPVPRGPISNAPYISLGKQIAGGLGASGTGIAAALAVDQLINKIDNPLVTAVVAPVFAGTAALSLAGKGVSAIGDAMSDAINSLGGGEYTAAQIAQNRMLVSAGVTPLAAQTNLTRSGTRVVRGTQIQ